MPRRGSERMKNHSLILAKRYEWWRSHLNCYSNIVLHFYSCCVAVLWWETSSCSLCLSLSWEYSIFLPKERKGNGSDAGILLLSQSKMEDSRYQSKDETRERSRIMFAAWGVMTQETECRGDTVKRQSREDEWASEIEEQVKMEKRKIISCKRHTCIERTVLSLLSEWESQLSWRNPKKK